MITLQQGDITKIAVDAMVNAANSALVGGTGVNGAIRSAGGAAVIEGCKKIKEKMPAGCKTGEAVITQAGNLPARFVIHAVGPIWSGGNENESLLLANAYKNSLQLAVANKVTTISFPNISTGVYGFPKEMAANIAIPAVVDFLKGNNTIRQVIFICYDEESFSIYAKILKARNIDCTILAT